MRALITFIALAGISLAGCASPQLSRPAGWDHAKAADAEEARQGKYHYPLERIMDVSQYAFETEGFLFTRRDDDAKTFRTNPFKVKDSPNQQIVELGLAPEGELTVATWKHLEIIDYKDEDACKGDAACQKAFSEDWNWRIYKNLP